MQVRPWSTLTEHNIQRNVLRHRWWHLWSIKSSLQTSDSPSSFWLMLGYDSKLCRGMVTTWECSQFPSSKGVQECKMCNVLELCELCSEKQQDCFSLLRSPISQTWTQKSLTRSKPKIMLSTLVCFSSNLTS